MNKDLRMALQKRKIFNLDKNHLRKRKCPEREVQGISGKRSLFLTPQNKKTPEFQKIPERAVFRRCMRRTQSSFIQTILSASEFHRIIPCGSWAVTTGGELRPALKIYQFDISILPQGLDVNTYFMKKIGSRFKTGTRRKTDYSSSSSSSSSSSKSNSRCSPQLGQSISPSSTMEPSMQITSPQAGHSTS